VTPLPDLRDETLRITAFGREARDGVVRVRAWRPAERVARTLAGWLGCWALAAITLFIPVAHILLVPGFFIAGIVLLLRRSREDRSFVEGRGPCPVCGADQTFRLRGKFVLPKETFCPACRARLILEPSD
jgi:hypothetical protein